MNIGIGRVAMLAILGGIFLSPTVRGESSAAPSYEVYVSNERTGDLTVLAGPDFHGVATIPVGKRPRGIHASPDGKTVYVALSGTPVSEPPKLDAQGNPILHKGKDADDEKEAEADKAADGIGVVDVAQRKFVHKISAGSDPEQFALSPDGKRLYISNEDVGTATILDAATGKIVSFVVVGQEPEGVAIAPDGKSFYVTCETAGKVFVFDTASGQQEAMLQVEPRPRSAAFLKDGTKAFIPSESVGKLNVIDAVQHALLKTIILPAGSRPMCVAVAPDGKDVYVSTGRAGTICVVDAHTYEVVGKIPVGQRPWGIAISPDGKYLFAANGPSNDVSVVDLAAGKEVARVKAGGSPWGVVVVPRGS